MVLTTRTTTTTKIEVETYNANKENYNNDITITPKLQEISGSQTKTYQSRKTIFPAAGRRLHQSCQ
jgi:hypothetical protein